MRASLPGMPRRRLSAVAACIPVIASPPGVARRGAGGRRSRRDLALAGEPWRDRQGFVDALEGALGGLELDMPRLPEAVRAEDPFLWSVMGRFGAAVPGERSSGGIVTCSRYGIATRDRLAERNLSDPAVFAIFGATQAAPDDAEVWPETGGRAAGLRGDVERHAAGGDPARGARLAALEARFETGHAARRPGGSGRGLARPAGGFGAGGLPADRGAWRRDTVVELESARIELRVAHQQIRFRSFLLNGGM
jgi:hypothetical protein